MKRTTMKYLSIIICVLLSGCVQPDAPADTPERIICMSSSHVAFLNELGIGDKIVGVAGIGLVSSHLPPDVADIGYDRTVNYELIAALDADLILLSGLEDERLKNLGTRTLDVRDWLEPTPLGRARWIVEIARACGIEQRGEEKYSEIEKAYNARKQSAAKFENKPKVMLNAPYRGVWYVPGAQNYMVKLVEDAGGECIATGTGSESVPIGIEAAYLAMKQADFWLNTNHYDSVDALWGDNPRFADIEVAVFNNNARTTPAGGSDFWESGVVRPEIILNDLVSIFHGSADSLYYYKRLK